MRILYQHRTLADGAEGIHIQEIVEAFEHLGHEVRMHALASSAARGVGKRSIWSRAKALMPGALFELAAIVYNLVDFMKFRAILARERPDFVYKRHAHYDVGIALAARRAGVPLVLEANAAYSSPQNRVFERVTFPRLSRWCERVAVNQAAFVVAVSTPMAQYLRNLAQRPADVLVVPNGANPERFAPHPDRGARVRASLGLEEALVIGWSGILREWHRVDLVLAALATLPGCRLLVVGDGPDRTRLQAYAQAHGVDDRMSVTGRVSHADMPGYVAAFDVAVAAHDGTGYASPMKVLEYMAMALPVVAPRMPNIEDFIDDGVDGLLFAPGDAGSLAAVLGRLASDPALRESLGRAARRKIEQERNWLGNARRVLAEIHDRGLAQPRATAPAAGAATR